MNHDRIIALDGASGIVSCPCGWSTRLPARSGVMDLAAAAFREHVADALTAPTPDYGPPRVQIPPVHTALIALSGVAIWGALGLALVLR